jgi:hypothetical protein
MTNVEQLIFSNHFGSVTDKRIILNYRDGAEDLPIGQVSSVKYKHRRSYFFALGGFAVALAVLIFMLTYISKMKGEMVLVLVVLIIIGTLSGIANWIGHHEIIISVNGNDRKPLKAEMSKTREGRNFVDAVKKALASRQ